MCPKSRFLNHLICGTSLQQHHETNIIPFKRVYISVYLIHFNYSNFTPTTTLASCFLPGKTVPSGQALLGYYCNCISSLHPIRFRQSIMPWRGGTDWWVSRSLWGELTALRTWQESCSVMEPLVFFSFESGTVLPLFLKYGVSQSACRKVIDTE